MKHINELEKSLNNYLCWNKARMNCFAKMLLALFAVSTVNLKKLAIAFDGKVQLDSRYKRIKRFFALFDFNTEEITRWVFGNFHRDHKKVYIVIDRTNWFFGKAKINILTLGIAHEGLAIPLFWDLLDKAGNATGQEHTEIVKRFIKLFGKECIAGVLADREFANQTFFKYLNEHQIPFYIRVKEGSLVSFFGEKKFAVRKIFKSLSLKQQKSYIQPVIIHGQKLHIAAGRSERGELLIVASNQKENRQDKTAVSKYLRRWEIENLFQGLKSRGFCFEETHLTDHSRLKKLMCLLAVGFCWAHKIGEWRAKQRPIVLNKYRNSRRPQNSYFRYGLDFIREIVLHIYRMERQFMACLKQLTYPPNCLINRPAEGRL